MRFGRAPTPAAKPCAVADEQTVVLNDEPDAVEDH